MSLLYTRKLQTGGTTAPSQPVKKAFNNALAANDAGFQRWYKNNTWEAREGKPYSDQLVYDFYSFYKNGDYKNPHYNMHDHFPDTYKRPHHPTFSNESIYSTPENPGGAWKGEYYNPKGQFKYQAGGKTTKVKREEFIVRRDGTAIDNSNSRLKKEMSLKELAKETSDRSKLYTTGRIDKPQSIAYRNLQPKQQPALSKETRSREEMDRVKKAVTDAGNDKRLSALPLIYLNSPDKAVGDVLSSVGANSSMKFDTSAADRQDLAYNANNPYKTKDQKFDYALRKGLELVPGAAVNVLLAAEGNGATGLLRTINNAVNPVAGSGTSLIRGRDAIRRGMNGRLTTTSAIQETKRLGETAVVGSAKNEMKDEVIDGVNGLSPKNMQWAKFRKDAGIKTMPKTMDEAWRRYSVPASRQELPKSLEPYISRRVATPSREQEVFENSFGADGRIAEIAKRTTHYDSNGNIIPVPEGFDKLVTAKAAYDPKRGMFRRGGLLIRYDRYGNRG